MQSIASNSTAPLIKGTEKRTGLFEDKNYTFTWIYAGLRGFENLKSATRLGLNALMLKFRTQLTEWDYI